MSLILDALRKLDREKSSRRTGTIDIAAEILRPYLPPPKKRVWIYFTAVFLTAVATAAITYAVISKTSPPAAIKPPASSVQVTRAPVSDESVRDVPDVVVREPRKVQASIETKKPAETKGLTVIRKPSEGKKQPVAVKTPPPSPSPTPTPTEEKASSEVVPKEASVSPTDTKKPTEQTPKGSTVTAASLRLSGIVWSEEPSKRLAVINGMVTTEGYVFEGVKVMEIHPDHVLLLVNDQPLELSLNR